MDVETFVEWQTLAMLAQAHPEIANTPVVTMVSALTKSRFSVEEMTVYQMLLAFKAIQDERSLSRSIRNV